MERNKISVISAVVLAAAVSPALSAGGRTGEAQPIRSEQVWTTPSIRPEGFLFEVQLMNYAPFFDADVVDAIQKYRLGESAKFQGDGAVAAEWGYSFHNLKDGALDGAGRAHYGGYPTKPVDRQQALGYIRDYVLKTYVAGLDHPWYSMNGHYPYHHYAAEWGFDALGSEIGENITSYQIRLAFTRGAARQYSRPWFIDVSAWHGPGITDYSSAKPWGKYSAPDNGHSLSLYRRTYFMSYMAGAGSLTAEAGGVNFLLEDRDDEGVFKPSPLGRVGAEFYDFARRHPDRGVAYTPFGVVLDFYHGVYAGIEGKRVAFNQFAYTKGDTMTWRLLDGFFPKGWEVSNETGCIANGPLGDTCDVLLQNAPQKVLDSYPVLVLSGDVKLSEDEVRRFVSYAESGGTLLLNRAYSASFPAEMRGQAQDARTDIRFGKGRVILYGPDYDGRAALDILKAISPEVMPFSVEGGPQYLLNWKPDAWIVTVINNSGITKSFNAKPKISESKTQQVKLRYTGPRKVTGVTNLLTDADAKGLLKDGALELSLPPGELAVFEFALGD